jgi:tRNA U34 2-thiouridine synthase MnmA/TrmU
VVRFDAMLELADALGAARLATGHYARIARDEHGSLVRAAADPRKDQSYMLAKLDPRLLDRLSFPLGGLTKDAVRALAREAGLPVADKRESQDLCFVAGLSSATAGPVSEGPATSSTGAGGSSAGTRASTITRWASGAAWGSRRQSRCTS